MDGEIEIVEPHLPDDFRLILKQLEKVIEIYHTIIMAWANPVVVYRSKKEK